MITLLITDLLSPLTLQAEFRPLVPVWVISARVRYEFREFMFPLPLLIGALL